MSELALLGLIVLGVIVLSPLASRIGVPQPIAVALFGLGVALLPWAPTIDINPEYVLPLVLPPLLFAAALRTSLREFRSQASAVLLLAVVLTLVTAGVVGVVAWWLGLPWQAAAVLGAVVSPPDPVAATSVARRLRLPGRMVTILEGEGLFNDATALVLRAFRAARDRLGRLAAERPEQRDGVRIVDEEYERWERMVSSSGRRGPQQTEQVDRAREAGLAAERAEVLRARSSGAVPAETADRVLTEIESRSTRLPYLG